PALAGAAAGLLAGGLAATFYAAHCTDDSPLFVAVWYTIAVAMLALVGAAIGSRLARW
ncbi:NrsF family protein, partial [Nitratireductor sp. GCM10026969]|uniref:NrsF family protein n=1 Tax=Nitratireductor sp. GCM10026969 TaxID=3252645 RepID=UPI00360D1692